MMRGRLTVIALAGLIALAPPRVHADEAPQANPFGRINHFVVVYTENRSFDGVFGDFPGADGLASAKDIAPQTDFDGTVLKMLPPVRSRANEPDKRFPPGLANAPFDIAPFVPAAGKTLDMVHRFYQQQEQIHGGRNDRFAAVSDAGALVMGYYKSEGQELAALARDYVLADHFHHAAFGGSFLNHFFLICACAPKFETALPKMIAKIDPATGFLARTPASPRSTMDGGPVWENDGAVTSDFYAVNTLQPVAPPLSERAPPDERLPPQTLPTIGERLSEKGVTWAWFADGWTDVLGGKIKPYAPPENFQPHHQPFN